MATDPRDGLLFPEAYPSISDFPPKDQKSSVWAASSHLYWWWVYSWYSLPCWHTWECWYFPRSYSKLARRRRSCRYWHYLPDRPEGYGLVCYCGNWWIGLCSCRLSRVRILHCQVRVVPCWCWYPILTLPPLLQFSSLVQTLPNQQRRTWLWCYPTPVPCPCR